MSIICSICHDFLTERPQSLPEDEELICKALMCGHLFHNVCILQWFRNGGTNACTSSYVDCPCCKKGTSLSNALRIYPTCEEDMGDSQTKKKIFNKLEECQQLMQQLSLNLESEKDAQESLRLENGKLQSELHELNENTKEAKAMYQILEESLNFKIDGLEKQNDELKQANNELRVKEKALYHRLELLRTVQKNGQEMLLAQKSVEQDCIEQLLLCMSPLEEVHDGTSSPEETEQEHNEAIFPEQIEGDHNEAIFPEEIEEDHDEANSSSESSADASVEDNDSSHLWSS